MAFTEDLSVFTDAQTGFGVVATLAGDVVRILFDAPGADALGGDVVTTEPSALLAASAGAAVGDELLISAGDLAAQLLQHAGAYTVRSVVPEPPDGVFHRLILARVS